MLLCSARHALDSSRPTLACPLALTQHDAMTVFA